MLFITIFVAGGVAFATVKSTPISGDGAGVVVALIAAAIPLTLLTFGMSWVNDQTGINSLIVHSWEFLSGMSDGGEVMANSKSCSGAGVNVMLGIIIWLVIFALLLINIVIGFVGVIGMPIGIVCAACCAIWSLITREREGLMFGLLALVVPTGCVILTGISFRIIHILSSVVMGC